MKGIMQNKSKRARISIETYALQVETEKRQAWPNYVRQRMFGFGREYQRAK